MVSSSVIVLTPCGICRDEDNANDMVVTTCGHTFHSDCVKEWETTQRAAGRTPKCSYCNIIYPRSSGDDDYNYDCYSSSSSIKHCPLRALSIQRVLIIEEGKPDPEKELINAQETLKTTQKDLKEASDKTHQLQADLANLRLEKESESKAHAQQINNILGDLKAEKQLRSKARGLHIDEKQRMQKRIDDGTEFIEKLKAERSEYQKEKHRMQKKIDQESAFIETLKAERKTIDNEKHRMQKKIDIDSAFIQKLKAERQDANVNMHAMKNANSKQFQINKALQLQMLKLTCEKGASRKTVTSMEPVFDGCDQRSILQDLNGAFQKLEVEYLTLKGLFDRKLEETSTSESRWDPMAYAFPINPILSGPQSCHSEILQPIEPIFVESDENLIDPILIKASENGQHPNNPFVNKSFGNGSSNKSRNNEGKSCAPFEPSASAKSEMLAKIQDLIVTKRNDNYNPKSRSSNKTSNPTNNQEPKKNQDTKQNTNITTVKTRKSRKSRSSNKNPIIVANAEQMSVSSEIPCSVDPVEVESIPEKKTEEEVLLENPVDFKVRSEELPGPNLSAVQLYLADDTVFWYLSIEILFLSWKYSIIIIIYIYIYTHSLPTFRHVNRLERRIRKYYLQVVWTLHLEISCFRSLINLFG